MDKQMTLFYEKIVARMKIIHGAIESGTADLKCTLVVGKTKVELDDKVVNQALVKQFDVLTVKKNAYEDFRKQLDIVDEVPGKEPPVPAGENDSVPIDRQ